MTFAEERILFSIITVCYNSEKCIEKTIESVLAQKYDNYEYLIVDGASTDQTVRISEKYSDKFEGKLRIISEKDKGIYDAMNKGIRNSIGEYIIFINSDDELERDILHKVAIKVKTLKSSNIVLYGNSVNIYRYPGCTDIKRYIKALPYIDKTNDEIRNSMCGIRHQSMFVHKTIFNNNGLFDINFKLYADWDFFIRTIYEGIEYEYINENVSYYTMDGASMTPNYRERHQVRLKNNICGKIDINYIKDLLSIHNLIRIILGAKGYCMVQYKFSRKKYSRKYEL